MMKKYKAMLILIMFLPFLVAIKQADAQVFKKQIRLNTYHPAPHGQYFKLFLSSTTVSPNCTAGEIGYNSLTGFRFCVVDDVWSEVGLFNYDAVNGTISLREDAWKFGIGTQTPLATLHVSSDGTSNYGDILAVGTFGSGTIPLEGAGTRLVWYPAKSALRVGTLDSGLFADFWNDSNIGDYSLAIGRNVRASGLTSIALGSFNRANAIRSFVIGGTTNLINPAAIEGFILGGTNNTVTGSGSFIIGGDSVTIGTTETNSGSIGYPLDGTFAMTNSDSLVFHGARFGFNDNAQSTMDVDGLVRLGNSGQQGYAIRDGQEAYVGRGYVLANGTLDQQNTNAVSVTKLPGPGRYRIDYDTLPLDKKPNMMITPVNAGVPIFSQITSLTTESCTVNFYNAITNALIDTDFSFVGIATLDNAYDGVIPIGSDYITFGSE